MDFSRVRLYSSCLRFPQLFFFIRFRSWYGANFSGEELARCCFLAPFDHFCSFLYISFTNVSCVQGGEMASQLRPWFGKHSLLFLSGLLAYSHP